MTTCQDKDISGSVNPSPQVQVWVSFAFYMALPLRESSWLSPSVLAICPGSLGVRPSHSHVFPLSVSWRGGCLPGGTSVAVWREGEREDFCSPLSVGVTGTPEDAAWVIYLDGVT